MFEAMVGSMGQINGTPYYLDHNIGTTETCFSRVQNSKFKNRRWVKKYRKKYSFKKFTPGAIMDNVNNRLFIHPEVFQAMQRAI